MLFRSSIEQIGTPAEIYDHPSSPFVMSFIGAVNILPRRALSAKQLPNVLPSEEQVFVRPHDVAVYDSPKAGTVPARLKRITHSGRDVQIEVILDNGNIITAQVARESIEYQRLKPGSELHIDLLQTHSFIPDFII